ncbi:MAG: hypothetical protein ACR2KJ_08070 [Jatrophihabitans sp.]
MRRTHLIAAATGGAAAIALLLPVTSASAEVTYCPYVITASSATVYSQPSTRAPLYDVLPHGAHITASQNTYAGTGGLFRKLSAAGASAYALTPTMSRTSGVCMSPNLRTANR